MQAVKQLPLSVHAEQSRSANEDVTCLLYLVHDNTCEGFWACRSNPEDMYGVVRGKSLFFWC